MEQCNYPNNLYERTQCNVDYNNLDNCIVNFEKYASIKEIAIDKGATAVVFRTYNKEIRCNTIVKIQVVGKTVESVANETRIGYLISNLQGFVNLINFWICGNTPEYWRQTQSETKQEKCFWLFPDISNFEITCYNIHYIQFL